MYSPLPTCSPANPLGSAATSAPTALSSNALLPLVYWYGHAETKRNPLLLDRLIHTLGEFVNQKLDADIEGKIIPSYNKFSKALTGDVDICAGRASGIIVDTPSSFASSSSSGSGTDHRYTLIKACVDAFRSRHFSSSNYSVSHWPFPPKLMSYWLSATRSLTLRCNGLTETGYL